MASPERPHRIYSIPPWRPFADDLAAGLLRLFPDPMQLARVLVLLPTRRSIRAVSDAFLRESDGAALLLPRMVPAGDLDIDEVVALEGGPLFDGLTGAAEARPVISPTARRLALTRILAAGGRMAAAEALALADRLAAALDTLEIEGKTAAEIELAVPAGGMQDHWRRNAEVLRAIMEHWPGLLADRGLMDAAHRRNLQLDGLASRWAANPLPMPVVMAGFSSAPPAVRRLARAVSRMPQGVLVLPGFDRALPAGAYELLQADADGPGLETHPQHGMAAILQTATIAPDEIEEWAWRSARDGSPAERAALVTRALLPPELSGKPMPAPSAQAVDGIRMIEAANPAEEALLIALAMRQVIRHEGRTAALVTPDRNLATRVRVQLQRFGIRIDDSAGQPLGTTLAGSLLLALADAAAERFAPVPLLGLMQHPLVRAGEPRLQWLGHVRSLDRLALRGVRPAPGLAGMAARLRQRNKLPDDLRDWWADEVAPMLAPLDPAPRTAETLVDALRHVAVALAGEGLWAGEAGRALVRLFENLEGCRTDLAGIALTTEDIAGFTSTLLAADSVRARANLHPQLNIWGPLEARLQTADLLVMGGLNEGSWPGLPAPDPFLAPAIRRALGLPGLARRTGMQAHDFASGLGASEVLLTRAVRDGGAPTVASRFWQRLQAAAGGAPDNGRLSPARAALLHATRSLDAAASAPRIPRPAPAPPAHVRPREISVTDVAMLKADPFSFYAKRILKLARLDPRDAEPTAGERGQIVHDIMRDLLDEGLPPPERVAELIEAELLRLGERPEIAALWRPRVVRMVDWALGQTEQDREQGWLPLVWEKRARLDIGGVELVGQVDRMDKVGNALRIIDYKTGGVPPRNEVVGLYRTQLALLAAIADAGLFTAIGDAQVEALEYWVLRGGRVAGEVRPALGKKAGAVDVRIHIAEAMQDMKELADRWLLADAPFTAKQHMVYGRAFGEHDHLARVAEWLGR